MAIAGKVYKEYNTPLQLGQLTDVKLKSLGFDDKDDRKSLLAALKKAGYIGDKRKPLEKAVVSPTQSPSSSSKITSPSGSRAYPPNDRQLASPSSSKRKRVDDYNEYLPHAVDDEDVADLASYDFGEILREEQLYSKSVIVNRAPIMAAWSMIVAERLHFNRQEALSIASVYTEMNAISEGISIGLYEKHKEKGLEAQKGGSQPYVELMGRRPLYRTKSGQWRALSNGSPVPPTTAFGYITRSIKQTTPYVMGSLMLLADSYPPDELKDRAWGLYLSFRPDVEGWGKKSELLCKIVLDLRRKDHVSSQTKPSPTQETPLVLNDASSTTDHSVTEEHERKRPKVMTLEEYEAALDADTTFDHVNLDLS